jgi:diaminopimelate epimerase
VSDFTKYEALGNDYLVVDPSRTTLPVTPESVRELCDRRRGIGADGVLRGPFIEGDSIRLQIFNSDGSECAKSGNGLRIFAHYLRAQGYVEADKFLLRTLAGDSAVEVVDFDAGVFTVALGSFTFDSEKVPAAGPMRKIVDEQLVVDGEIVRINCVNNGNPHCVIFDDDASIERISRLGPLISNSPLFPKGTNVQMVKVIDRRHLHALVWERGAGYTLASGSSACAIACVAHALGYVDPEVSVHMPGGELAVSISPSGQVFLTGAVRKIAEGTIAPVFRKRLLSDTGPILRRA